MDSAENHPSQMRSRQHLYADEIYRINSEVQSIANLYRDDAESGRRDLEDRLIQFVPCSFDRRLRYFRWLSVHDANWDWNDTLFSGAQTALRELFNVDGERPINPEELAARWNEHGMPATMIGLGKYWFEPLPPRANDRQEQVGWDFGATLDRWFQIATAPDWKTFDPDRHCHRSLVDLVAGRVNDTRLYMEGLAFQLIERAVNHEVPMRVRFIASNLLRNDRQTDFPPARFKCFYYGREGSVEAGPEDDWQYYSQDFGQIVASRERLLETEKQLLREMKANKRSRKEEGQWARSLQNTMMRLNARYSEQLSWFVTVPIYDGGTRSDPWGRLVGIIHAMIYRESNVAECKKIADDIINHSDRLLVAFRTVARAQVAAAPISIKDRSGPSLALQQFMRLLPKFQDWERVSVCSRTERENLGCWTRVDVNHGDQTDSEWTKCAGDCENCKTKRILQSGDAPQGGPVMLLGEDLSDVLKMPWISQKELGELVNLEFAFELPKYALIPEGERWKRLYRQYMHEQMDILRLLVPKVQSHRKALRNAAAAIMGRNMSHNIGSHVLARYSSKLGTLQKPNLIDTKEDRSGLLQREALQAAFLAYLQRRMDFLAEVATSDQPFWSEVLSLKEQVDRLDFNHQAKLFEPESPILLSYITGKETLQASAHWGWPPGIRIDQPTDQLISCPSGEVGIHALFVILENIIRNSARHSGGDATGWVDIFVALIEQSVHADLLKLQIIDPRSKLPPNSDVPQRINSILKESLLEPDSAPNPNYWGIREMQICAHFLRELPFFDLETRDDVDPRVLEAGKFDLGNGNWCLKYDLYLKRAKLVTLIVAAGSLSELRLDPAILRLRGVNILEGDLSASPNWERIALEAQGYGFLILSAPFCLDDISKAQRMTLPMRCLSLGEDRVQKILRDASESPNALNSTAWMEELHKEWAHTYQEKRDSWKDATLSGVVICHTLATKLSQTARNTGLFSASLTDSHEILNIDPLPPSLKEWFGALRTQKSSAIAAAWVDHWNKDVVERGGANLTDAANASRRPTAWVSVEAALSDSPHSEFLRRCPREGGWEILAAALARVAVMDERVQSELEKDLRGVPLQTAWPLMGVWVPDDHVCDLNVPNFDSCKNFLRNPTKKREQLPIDILVLHLTILEGLHRTRAKGDLSDTLDALVEDTAAQSAEIIIVTGRGVPATRIGIARYLPISVLLESLTGRTSKLALMRALWSAGRPLIT